MNRPGRLGADVQITSTAVAVAVAVARYDDWYEMDLLHQAQIVDLRTKTHSGSTFHHRRNAESETNFSAIYAVYQSL